MRSILVALALAALLASGASAQPTEVAADRTPDPSKAPGRAPYHNATKVCVIKSTMDARNVPDSAKKELYDSYGDARCQTQCNGPQGCEIDQLNSVELGDTSTIDNLWPQPYDGDQYRLENTLRRRPGRITLSR